MIDWTVVFVIAYILLSMIALKIARLCNLSIWEYVATLVVLLFIAILLVQMIMEMK